MRTHPITRVVVVVAVVFYWRNKMFVDERGGEYHQHYSPLPASSTAAAVLYTGASRDEAPPFAAANPLLLLRSRHNDADALEDDGAPTQQLCGDVICGAEGGGVHFPISNRRDSPLYGIRSPFPR